MDKRIIEIADKMNKKGFIAECVSTGEEAKNRVLEILEGDSSVGIGGSVTVSKTGIYTALAENGFEIYSAAHAVKTGGDMDEARRKGLTADAYILSANAVTEDGCIINIDGTGNRVAAAIYGPEKVVYVIGKNKVVKDFTEGIERIKRNACPPNARRLGYNTPCAVTGKCADCRSKDRMCNVTSIVEFPLRGKQTHVIFIDADFGY